MIILDTDHFTVLRYSDDSRYPILTQRLLASKDQRIVTTVVTVEEQMRGWLAEINRWRDIGRQRAAYDRLAMLVGFLSDWETLGIDERAEEQFNYLRKQRIRIGTQDLKIAAIALAHRGLLLSANLRDFRRVPGLTVENWLE
jgi:tRNA(fMet)-specific endonuclease VapC